MWLEDYPVVSLAIRTPLHPTVSVALLATGLLSTFKGFVSQNTHGGRTVGLSILYNLMKWCDSPCHQTSTEWLTIETGAGRL